MDYRDWIRIAHEELRPYVERTVLKHVERPRRRSRPGGVGNSIARWLWHVARAEDVVVNAVVGGREQVLLAGRWADRLGVDDPRVGTG